MVKRILFICKHNRFRSKIAEAFFNKLNKNKNYAAESAGLIKGELSRNKNLEAAASDFGLKIEINPRTLSVDLLEESYNIIIVADDIPISLFKTQDYIKKGIAKKIIKWEVPDVSNKSKMKFEKSIRIIKEKVKEFIKTLK